VPPAIATSDFLSISTGGPMNGTGMDVTCPSIRSEIAAASRSIQVLSAKANTARMN
jgi:hypothetical protein